MDAKVSEIFRSVQGEGLYVGVRQVFIRFFACHIRCSWCDTPESISGGPDRYTQMSLDDVAAEIVRLKDDCHSVSLTGGEPLLQSAFIGKLIPLIHRAGLPVYLETNGILAGPLAEVVDGVDLISMDVKMPSSTGIEAFWEEHRQFIRTARRKETELFIKAVVTMGTVEEDLRQVVRMIAAEAPETLLILQPNTDELKDGVLNRCLEFQAIALKELKDVRIIPQMHKWMDVR